MARRVFFSFDFKRDVFRANQVRNVNVVGVEQAGYYDHSEYEEAKTKGPGAIERMLLRHLKDTTVTVVLIGTETASRPWVQWELSESIRRGNGLVGIRIHHLEAPPPAPFAPRTLWAPSPPGPIPAVPPGIEFPVYAWDWDLERFSREIEAAGKRGEALRASRRVRAQAQAGALRGADAPPAPPPAAIRPAWPPIRSGFGSGPPSLEDTLRRYFVDDWARLFRKP